MAPIFIPLGARKRHSLSGLAGNSNLEHVIISRKLGKFCFVLFDVLYYLVMLFVCFFKRQEKGTGKRPSPTRTYHNLEERWHNSMEKKWINYSSHGPKV